MYYTIVECEFCRAMENTSENQNEKQAAPREKIKLGNLSGMNAKLANFQPDKSRLKCRFIWGEQVEWKLRMKSSRSLKPHFLPGIEFED